MTRGQRGRLIGRVMIGLTVLGVGLIALGFLTAPGTMGGSPMFSTPPDILGLPVGPVLGLVGFVGVVVGLAWMVRIHRADPEPDQHAWRYRRDR